MGKQWTFEMQGPVRDWPSIVDKDGNLIARTYGPDSEGAARLIAAAPAMLAALKDLRKQLSEHVKMDVRKHFSLMVAENAAFKAIRAAENADAAPDAQ